MLNWSFRFLYLLALSFIGVLLRREAVRRGLMNFTFPPFLKFERMYELLSDSLSLGLYVPGPGMPLNLRVGSGNRFLLGDQLAARELLN